MEWIGLPVIKSRYILSPMSLNGYSAWLEIDLEIIRQNVKELLRISQTGVMAVVKANGYGHGAAEIARASVQAGATWCAVARLEEAIALRRAGLNCQILVLGYTSPDRVEDAISNNICLTIYDRKIGEEYADRVRYPGAGLRLHIKVDTGMGRLGISPDTAVDFIENLSKRSGLIVEGIFTHFARADEPQAPTTNDQLAMFDKLVGQLRQDGIVPKFVHAANSAATINFPFARYDLVRTGISLYGLSPSPESPIPPELKPALTWKTRLTSVRFFPPGHGISYGHIYHTSKTERIGSIAIGYADGFRRVTGNVALIRGKRVPVVGRVCMDQCMLQLDDVPDAAIGDEVVLLGSQGNERISAEEIAEHWGTINYEVICGLSTRLPRVYLNS